MISYEQWMGIERGDVLVFSTTTRVVLDESICRRVHGAKAYDRKMIVLRKMRGSWTDPNPLTVYLWADLNRRIRKILKGVVSFEYDEERYRRAFPYGRAPVVSGLHGRHVGGR